MDKAALYQLSYGVYILGVKNGEKRSGCVVNTVMQVTSNPPRVTTAVSKENNTHDMIAQSGMYTAAVLGQDVPMELIGKFGFKSGRDTDKFQGVNYQLDSRGIPFVTDSALTVLSCQVVDKIDLGSHTLFVSEVVDGQVLAKGEPMTYAYYHNVKKGTAPKAAPTYREETAEISVKAEPAKATASEFKGWRCTVCGYIHPDEEFPEGFECPICGQPKEVFVRL